MRILVQFREETTPPGSKRKSSRRLARTEVDLPTLQDALAWAYRSIETATDPSLVARVNEIKVTALENSPVTWTVPTPAENQSQGAHND